MTSTMFSMDRLFNWILNLFMVLMCIIMLYPFLYVLAYSLSDSLRVMTETVTVFPLGFTLEHYETVLSNRTIYNALFISIVRTLVGIFYALAITSMAAYAISKTQMPGNRAISLYLIVPMFISGGLLPTYILMYNLGLFNSFWVYILPYGFAAFNMLIMRTFFAGIPTALEESARMDGAGDAKIFFRVILPLSKPVIATIALFTGVFHWNSWFDALLYVTQTELHPLQFVLQKLLSESLATQIMAQEGRLRNVNQMQVSPESIKMSTLVISTVPIVMIYPFLQRYFIKGVMIGAIKG